MSWRKRLPSWLRRVVHRAWPERWTQAEIDEIKQRAAKMAAQLGERDPVPSGHPATEPQETR